jgi:hypothetical protein
MKRAVMLLISLTGFGLLFMMYVSGERTVSKPPLAYFPRDEGVDFLDSKTNVSMVDQVDSDEYKIDWTFQSDLERRTYLRQDLSLLFEDGRLIDKQAERQENARKVYYGKKILCEDSGHFQAISVHHAEIHKANGKITSRLTMSYDQLYVTVSPVNPIASFKIPQTEEENEWKNILDHATREQLHYAWDDLIKAYHIQPKDYYQFPLPYLHVFSQNTLPGLSERETEMAVARLWNELYNHYFLGLHTSDDETVTPIGSTVPLVLLDKNGEEFIVLIKAANGQNVKIVQPIADPKRDSKIVA